ncbi:hypothetical protein CFB44_07785 [Burkholderia sp. AU31280]|nr:hypothetical protein CFB44_07785 [Burkholderia sp. AU31280]
MRGGALRDPFIHLFFLCHFPPVRTARSVTPVRDRARARRACGACRAIVEDLFTFVGRRRPGRNNTCELDGFTVPLSGTGSEAPYFSPRHSMKQFQKPFVLLALMAAFGSTSAFAADGTVNFHGKIVATTCKIDNSNIQVPLGAIGIDQLAEAGRESRRVPFQIALSECNEQLSGVRAQFEGLSHGEDATLLAVGTGSKDDAKGVGIQLMHEDGKQIGINTESDTLQLTPGSNVLNFAANYVSTSDQTEAGEANGTASFTLNYR